MKTEKIIELVDLMMTAQERYFKSGKNPALLGRAKSLEGRVRRAIRGAKEENPQLFQPEPLHIDFPGKIFCANNGAPGLSFEISKPQLDRYLETMRRAAGKKELPVRVIISPEE